MVAGMFALNKVLIPSLDLWDTILPRGYGKFLYGDNTAMIRVAETGRNPTMRYLDRVHSLSVQGFHDCLFGSHSPLGIKLLYRETRLMAADVYTKHFTEKAKWLHALLLIGMFDVNDIARSCCDLLELRQSSALQPKTSEDQRDQCHPVTRSMPCIPCPSESSCTFDHDADISCVAILHEHDTHDISCRHENPCSSWHDTDIPCVAISHDHDIHEITASVCARLHPAFSQQSVALPTAARCSGPCGPHRPPPWGSGNTMAMQCSTQCQAAAGASAADHAAVQLTVPSVLQTMPAPHRECWSAAERFAVIEATFDSALRNLPAPKKAEEPNCLNDSFVVKAEALVSAYAKDGRGEEVETIAELFTLGMFYQQQAVRADDGSQFLKPEQMKALAAWYNDCLLYTSPSPRDGLLSRMPSSA